MTLKSLNSNLISAFVGIAFCMCLVFISLPRLFSAVYLLYPERINKKFNEAPSSININQQLKSESYTRQALQWLETAESWELLTLSLMRQFNAVDLPFKDLKLQGMYQANTQGLSFSPIAPYGWYRLASIEQAQYANPNKIINNIRLSCYSGRVEPALLLKRIRLLHSYRIFLDDEMQDIFYDQINLASLYKFWGLVRLVKQQPSLLVDVKHALQFENEQLTKFLQKFEKHSQKN